MALLAGIASAAAAGIGLAVVPVPYHATALIAVTPIRAHDPTLTGVPVLTSSPADPKFSLDTAQGIVGAAPVAQLAAGRMGSAWTERRVASHVRVTVHAGTDLIDVTATAATRRLALRLANVYAAAGVEQRARQLQPAIRAALGRALGELEGYGPEPTSASAPLAARARALAGLVGQGDPSLQLAGPARLAAQPGLTHAALIVLAAFASGLVLGLLAWWFATRLGRRAITTERRLSELTGLPILGRLSEAVFRHDSGSPVESASRELRNVLTLLELEDRAPRTLALVSAAPGDGKTSAAIALAGHLAGHGKLVALLDLDWRNQDAFRRLGGRRHDATADGEGEGPTEELVGTPGAAGLMVGASHGPESADAIEKRIADASASVDVVIVDTAAVGLTRDALAAASRVQSVLLIVRLGQTPENALGETRDMLARAGVKPVGVIVFTSRGASARRAHALNAGSWRHGRRFARA